MSSVSSRPKVQSVSSTVLSEAASAVTGAAGGLATLVLASLTLVAREAYRAYAKRNTLPSRELKPVSSLRQRSSRNGILLLRFQKRV